MRFTVYGSDICKDCRRFDEVIAERGLSIDHVDITADTTSLRAFLHIRDTAAVFAGVRERGGIGIPCFVAEDGTVSLDPAEALSWIGEPPYAGTDTGSCMTCG